MRKKNLLFGVLAALGLALYLWPALPGACRSLVRQHDRPALPALLFLGAAALAPLKDRPLTRRLAALLLFAGLIVFLAGAPAALDWKWGLIESSGVRLIQAIPRGALPTRGPATLHVRIASPLMPPSAQLEIFRPESSRIYSSLEDHARQRPYVTIPLPDWLLEASRAGPADQTFVSLGGYGPNSYLLFPVIPPPWSTPARRAGSPALSPATGIFHRLPRLVGPRGLALEAADHGRCDVHLLRYLLRIRYDHQRSSGLDARLHLSTQFETVLAVSG